MAVCFIVILLVSVSVASRPREAQHLHQDHLPPYGEIHERATQYFTAAEEYRWWDCAINFPVIVGSAIMATLAVARESQDVRTLIKVIGAILTFLQAIDLIYSFGQKYEESADAANHFYEAAKLITIPTDMGLDGLQVNKSTMNLILQEVGSLQESLPDIPAENYLRGLRERNLQAKEVAKFFEEYKRVKQGSLASFVEQVAHQYAGNCSIPPDSLFLTSEIVQSYSFLSHFAKEYNQKWHRFLRISGLASSALISIVGAVGGYLDSKGKQPLVAVLACAGGIATAIDEKAPYAWRAKKMAASEHGFYEAATKFKNIESQLSKGICPPRSELAIAEQDFLAAARSCIFLPREFAKQARDLMLGVLRVREEGKMPQKHSRTPVNKTP